MVPSTQSSEDTFEENLDLDDISGSESDDDSEIDGLSLFKDAIQAGRSDKFDVDKFHQFILNFIILDDQSLDLVESRTFRDLLLVLRHDLKEHMIPSRTKINHLIIQAWHQHFQVLKRELESAVGQISLTMDIWRGRNRRPYLAITAHWIAKIEQTPSLQLKSSLIAFHCLPVTYDGEVLAKTALNLLDRAEITSKIGHFTLGNTGNNETMMKSLESMLEARKIPFDAADRKVMCFGHVVDLSSERVICAVDNTAYQEDDLTDGASASNPIALARAVVQTIQRSDIAFDEVIVNGNDLGWFRQGQPPQIVQLDALQLFRDVRTQWDSVFLMLNRLREMRPAVDHFFALLNSDLAKYKFSSNDWLKMQDVEIVLCMTHLVQKAMSSERNPTLSGAIPEFEMSMKKWEKIVEKNPHMEQLVQPGLNCVYTYYGRMDRTRAYIVAMVLNPAVRMAWIHKHWDQEHITITEKKILQTMLEYRERAATSRNAESHETDPDSHGMPESTASLQKRYGINFDCLYVGEPNVKERTIEEEYQAYITAPLSSKDMNILGFWDCYGASFPTLFAMAMDYLPIQASAIPCKRIISARAEIDKQGKYISPLLMEALQIVKYHMEPKRLNFMEDWMTSEEEMVGDVPADEDPLRMLLDSQDSLD